MPAASEFGSIEALACVAGGFAMAGPIHDQPVDVWRKQFALNLDTAYTVTRAVLGGMVEQERGSIVYVGSRAALRPFPGASGYIVAKAAVLALMQAVDAEVRGFGVRANVVVPNVVDTPRNREREPGCRLLQVDDGGRAGPRHRMAVRGRFDAGVRGRHPRLWT